MSEQASEYKRKMEETIANLERFVQILKGDTTTPGVLRDHQRMKETLYGTDKEMGLAMRVKILWVAGVWLFGAAATALGFIAHPYLIKLGALLK